MKTRKKRKEYSLDISDDYKEKYEPLLNNMREGFALVDEEENFVELSRLKALSEVLSREEMRGKELLKVNIDGNVCIIRESKGVFK